MKSSYLNICGTWKPGQLPWIFRMKIEINSKLPGNNNDGMQLKFIFVNNNCKQRMLINALANGTELKL